MLRARQEQRKGILWARRAVNASRQDHLDPRLQRTPLTMSISGDSNGAQSRSLALGLADREGNRCTSAFRFGSVPMSLGHRKVTGLAGAFWGERA